MKPSPLNDRLNQILPRLFSPELRNNQGLGNEIGFYIFDYPAERELEMRDFLPNLGKGPNPIRYAHINLFQLVIDHLRERKLLDRAIDLQTKKGDEALSAALKGPLHEQKIAQVLVGQIDSAATELVLISGVDSVYPMLRTHTLLSALHPLMQSLPLVMFYPGHYDGLTLKLFDKLGDDHRELPGPGGQARHRQGGGEPAVRAVRCPGAPGAVPDPLRGYRPPEYR
jgi:hypothetical protein